MKAAAYIRVSTDKEEQKSSLENQREFFEKYIPARGDELVHIYCDKGKSATKMQNRRDLQRMRKDARSGIFQKLYVKDISRLFRNTLDFITVTRELNSYGVSLHLLNMGEGKDIDGFTLNIMAMLAENESQRISEKVKFGKQLGKEKGRVPNFVFGYDRIDKFTLIPDPIESEWVRRIFDLYTEEKWGMARIASYLYKNNVRTKKGGNGALHSDWSQNTVGGILKNEIYTGRVINGKQSSTDIFTNKRKNNPKDEWYIIERPEFRIISDEQFNRAKQLMEMNAQTYKKSSVRRSDKHLFSNILKCGACGFSFRRYEKKYSEDGQLYAWWTCSKRSAYGSNRCDSEYVRLDEMQLKKGLDKLFNQILMDKSSLMENVERKCGHLVKEFMKNNEEPEMEAIRRKIEELKDRRDRIKMLALEGIITPEEAKKDMLPVNTEIERLLPKLAVKDDPQELLRRVREKLGRLVYGSESISFTGLIDNNDLKRIIKEIRVSSKHEIDIFFAQNDMKSGAC